MSPPACSGRKTRLATNLCSAPQRRGDAAARRPYLATQTLDHSRAEREFRSHVKSSGVFFEGHTQGSGERGRYSAATIRSQRSGGTNSAFSEAELTTDRPPNRIALYTPDVLR